MVEITVEQVREELERCIEEAGKEQGAVDYSKGLTGPEIADRMERGVDWVRKRIKTGINEGTIVRDKAKRENLAGYWVTVPVYRPADNNQDPPLE